MVALFPGTVAVEFLTTALIQVDERHTLDGSYIGCPLSLRFANGLARLGIKSMARRERHQNGVGTLRPYFLNILAQVGAIAIDGVLPLQTLVEANVHCIGIDTGNHRTGPFLIEKLTIVVMSDADDYPVAWLQGFAHSRPQVGIERTSRHAAQCLVLHSNLSFVKILVGIVAPTPLAV